MSAGAGNPPAKRPGSRPERTGWPKLLSLAVHEFRSPLTVVSGYIRMLLKERAGPLPDQQRRLLEEAEKSCARLSTLLAELSELSHLEAGTAPFNRSAVDLNAVLQEVIASLPPLPEGTVAIELSTETQCIVDGDAVRLKSALSSILVALRRELVTSDTLSVQADRVERDGRQIARITIGETARMETLIALAPADLATFDEWRGGNGLGLANARRIIEAHGGGVWSVSEHSKAVAVLSLPLVG
jgi:histidine kinase